MLALSAPEGCTNFREAPATHRVTEFLRAVCFTALLDSLDNITGIQLGALLELRAQQ